MFILADIRHRYNQYEDLIKYWHDILSILKLDIDYDEPVLIQDTISKIIIIF